MNEFDSVYKYKSNDIHSKSYSNSNNEVQQFFSVNGGCTWWSVSKNDELDGQYPMYANYDCNNVKLTGENSYKWRLYTEKNYYVFIEASVKCIDREIRHQSLRRAICIFLVSFGSVISIIGIIVYLCGNDLNEAETRNISKTPPVSPPLSPV